MSARKPLAEAFGRTVRELRHAKGLALISLANAAGIDINRLEALEVGTEEANIVEATRIAAALGVKLSDLLLQVGEAIGEPL